VTEPTGLRGGQAELIGLLRSDETYEQTLDRVVRLACAIVPGCGAASITMWRDDRPYTAVSTAGLAQAADDAQYETGEGPCLAASRDGEVHAVPDIATDARWPAFAERAAERGARASLSVPLAVRGEPFGALNMYSDQPDGLRDGRDLGMLCGAQAAVTIANARAYEQARALGVRLRETLDERAVVDRATGVLMARHRVGAVVAAALLEQMAERDGVPLTDVAARVANETRPRAASAERRRPRTS
jgi:GAF domain-containing protein